MDPDPHKAAEYGSTLDLDPKIQVNRLILPAVNGQICRLYFTKNFTRGSFAGVDGGSIAKPVSSNFINVILVQFYKYFLIFQLILCVG